MSKLPAAPSISWQRHNPEPLINRCKLPMRRNAKVDHELLSQQVFASQEQTPASHEEKKAMAAARRARRNARKIAARRYDGLRSEFVRDPAFIFHVSCGRQWSFSLSTSCFGSMCVCMHFLAHVCAPMCAPLHVLILAHVKVCFRKHVKLRNRSICVDSACPIRHWICYKVA